MDRYTTTKNNDWRRNPYSAVTDQFVFGVTQRSDRLGAIVVSKTESTLAAEAICPEATDIDVGLGDLGVGEEEPGTEDWLGKNVQHGVGNNLAVNGELSAAVSNAPDDWVGSPDNNSKYGNGIVKFGNSLRLVGNLSTAVDSQVPNDDKVGDASNGVPSPFLRSAL